MCGVSALLWIISTLHYSAHVAHAGRAAATSLRTAAAATTSDTRLDLADAARTSGTSVGRSHRRAHHKRAGAKSANSAGFMPPILYVPKVGLANVTTPTAFPPPPPVLDPWKDGQPLDTALGSMIVNHFAVPPTSTPPPSQAALNLAFGCPVLLNWPSNLEVEAPDPCRSTWNGTWRAQGVDDTLIQWSKACNIFTRNLAPLVTYAMPNGDVFGNSQTLTTLTGQKVALRDCSWNHKYTVVEKNFWQNGKPDEDSCEKYQSCYGTVYQQFLILDANDQVIAQTAYLNLFAGTVSIISPSGIEIATAMRMGDWNPMDDSECKDSEGAQPRKWLIRYSPSAPGVFASATEQWPIAEMVTMIAVRDTSRLGTGLCEPDACETLRATFIFTFSFFTMCTACILAIVFRRMLLFWLVYTLQEIETQFCPKRMVKPSKYIGG